MNLFYDLHIHSCLSPCSSDEMTPNNIVNMSILKTLDVIAVTDHNTIGNVESVIKVAEDEDLLIIPGLELQTKEEVHLICLFESLKYAQKFCDIIDERRLKIDNKTINIGNQYIMDEHDEIIEEYPYYLLTSIDISLEETLSIVDQLKGVVIPAHVDRNANSIISNLGFIPDHYNFRYVEISKNPSAKDYLYDQSFKNKYNILRNSDAHDLSSINEPMYSIDVDRKDIKTIIEKLRRGNKMRELSLHILDIAQNSIRANADNLRIAIIEDLDADKLTIKIKDDGTGMDDETLKSVVNPFYTTRTTRDVGLGIPMFKSNAESCEGAFDIQSEVGVGTEIIATFKRSHIDRVPLGNMADTLTTIINGDPSMDVVYTHCVGDNKFTLNTREIKKRLGEVAIDNIDVLIWLREYIKENLEEIGYEV